MQVLFIGCGMSELPEQLHDAGFKRVAGVAYVQGLVDWMKWRNKKRNGLLYLTADLTDATAGLPVSELIVDKAALDAVVCTHHSRDKAALAVLRNAHRSLEPGGTYMLISHAGPDDRLGLLQKLDWKIQVKSVERQGLATLIKGFLTSVTCMFNKQLWPSVVRTWMCFSPRLAIVEPLAVTYFTPSHEPCEARTGT